MDIQNMIRAYTDWLYSSFSNVKVGDSYEITTPYLDRYNDHIQIYVTQKANGSYLLSDDGNILSNLSSSGLSFSRPGKRREMLFQIAQNFGVAIRENCLEIQATRENSPQKTHMLLQAMLTIDDMFGTETNSSGSSRQKSSFTENVGLYLDSHEIYYSKDFSLTGKTGSLYVYEYHLQRTRDKAERFCKTINRLTETTRNLTLFNWGDTIDKRKGEGELIVFVNDETSLANADLEAFQIYNVKYILWSQRQKADSLQLLVS